MLLFVGFVLITGNKNFDTPYPDIMASKVPDVIALREYMVFSPAHFATLNVPMDKFEKM